MDLGIHNAPENSRREKKPGTCTGKKVTIARHTDGTVSRNQSPHPPSKLLILNGKPTQSVVRLLNATGRLTMSQRLILRPQITSGKPCSAGAYPCH